MDDLKECPFCGGEAQHLRLNNVVGCQPCGMWMADHRKEDWNRRAVPQANADRAILAAAAPAPASQPVDSVDTPEFQQPMNDLWVSADARKQIADLIDAHCAALVAKARLDGYNKGANDVQAISEPIINRTVERAEKAEQALAQAGAASKTTPSSGEGEA